MPLFFFFSFSCWNGAKKRSTSWTECRISSPTISSTCTTRMLSVWLVNTPFYQSRIFFFFSGKKNLSLVHTCCVWGSSLFSPSFVYCVLVFSFFFFLFFLVPRPEEREMREWLRRQSEAHEDQVSFCGTADGRGKSETRWKDNDDDGRCRFSVWCTLVSYPTLKERAFAGCAHKKNTSKDCDQEREEECAWIIHQGKRNNFEVERRFHERACFNTRPLVWHGANNERLSRKKKTISLDPHFQSVHNNKKKGTRQKKKTDDNE